MVRGTATVILNINIIGSTLPKTEIQDIKYIERRYYKFIILLYWF